MTRFNGTISLLGLLSALSLTFSGCSEPASSVAFSVFDSAGIRIVETHSFQWDSGSFWHPSEDPTLQIGSREGDGPLQLFNVSGALRLSDGRIAVLNSGSNTVKVFGEDGAFLFEFGGDGDGPGEFRDLGSIHSLTGDTLLLWDGLRPGFSLFSTSGDFLRSQRLTPPGSEMLAGVEPLLNGLLVVRTYASPLTHGGERGVGVYRDPAPVFLFDRTGELLDTLSFFLSTEYALMEVAGRTLFGAAPFAKATYLDVHENRVYVGTAETMEVEVLDPGGEVRTVSRHSGSDLALTEDDQAWYRARMIDMAKTPMEQQMLGPVLDAQVFPEARAAYSDLRVDREGAVWLRTGRHFPPLAPSNEWTVISEEGVFLGTVTFPERFEVFELGTDYVLGLWKDELDVEFIRLYALDRSVGAT